MPGIGSGDLVCLQLAGRIRRPCAVAAFVDGDHELKWSGGRYVQIKHHRWKLHDFG
jgi:hypothetical protein